MILRSFGSVAILLVGTGLIFADSCPSCCQPVPTIPLPPIRLFHQTSEAPVHAPPVALPGPVIFHKEVAPPLYVECPPSPPIQVFRLPPPTVPTFVRVPPPVELFRREPTPPECPQPLPPRPPITVFHRLPEGPTCGPTLVAPPITVFHKPQPSCPVEVCPTR